MTQCVVEFVVGDEPTDDARLQPPQSQTGDPTPAPCTDAVLTRLFMSQQQKGAASLFVDSIFANSIH